MYQSDTEILFPMRVAPNLRDLRGDAWRDLVDQVCRAADASLEQLAFTLLLVRLSGCLTCHSHSYRALRGCTLCAKHTVRRFRGEDSELLVLFPYARDEVDAFFERGQVLADFFSDIPSWRKK
ncbi:MAG: hypothetical protein V3S81_02070 [Anaerolineales bacterium]